LSNIADDDLVKQNARLFGIGFAKYGHHTWKRHVSIVAHIREIFCGFGGVKEPSWEYHSPRSSFLSPSNVREGGCHRGGVKAGFKLDAISYRCYEQRESTHVSLIFPHFSRPWNLQPHSYIRTIHIVVWMYVLHVGSRRAYFYGWPPSAVVHVVVVVVVVVSLDENIFHRFFADLAWSFSTDITAAFLPVVTFAMIDRRSSVRTYVRSQTSWSLERSVGSSSTS